MTAYEWLDLLSHFAMLSVLAVGGALSIVPEMHRYLVNEHFLMSEPLFSQSLTLSQIAPGPNILLVAVMGWNIGNQHAASIAQGVPVVLVGLFTAGLLLLCTVIPSSLLTFTMSTWLQKHQHALGVRAFKTGMLPLVTGLMLSTGWLLESASNPIMDWRLMVMCGISTLLVLFTRIHLLWLMLVGALAAGVFGL